ncbi:MAG: FG-GAP repeat domain-containing protein, partial [Planctomycetales bacterium]
MGFGAVEVWINAGDGTFAEQSHDLGIRSDAWNVCLAAADIDNDGLVDIYVMTYADWQPDPKRICYNDKQLHDICGPTMFPGARDVVFVNTGQRFEDVSSSAGIVAQSRGLGIVAADLDDNGFVDFAVVNDVQENQLYFNSGTLPWGEDGILSGIAYSNSGEREGSMGIDLADFDGDGGPDLLYTN